MMPHDGEHGTNHCDEEFVYYMREEEKPDGYTREAWQTDIDRLLAIERKAIIERIRERMVNEVRRAMPEATMWLGTDVLRVLADEEPAMTEDCEVAR
jgi:hypothetical protein